MTKTPSHRVAYFNGRILPESEVVVPFRDRGFLYGDAVFDMTRTFGHRIFKLKEHIERFYRSLKYVQIDPGLTPDEMKAITEEVVEKNLPLLGLDEDYWVGQRVSRGLSEVEGEKWERSGPTTIVECTPLPLRRRARLYRDGINVIVPSVRRVPPECLSPRVKSHNYLNLILGDLAARALNPEAWAILLDINGNVAEGQGSNFFTVQQGNLYTPREQYVLGGISRETVIELAHQLGIQVIEKDLDLFDVYNAEEAFLTSTSLCICGVRAVNGVEIGDGRIPGTVTERLTEAYTKLVNYKFVDQYLKHLEDEPDSVESTRIVSLSGVVGKR